MATDIKTIQKPRAISRRLLHTFIALLVLIVLSLGLYMTRATPQNPTDIKILTWIFSLHKTAGATIFLLAICWVIAFLRRPYHAADHLPHEQFAAAAAKITLLVSLFILPLSGIIQYAFLKGDAAIWLYPLEWIKQPANPALASVFGQIHHFFGIMLAVVFAAHLAGALKHHFLDKDGTLTAMFSGKNPPPKSNNPKWHRFGQMAGMGLATIIVIVALVSVETKAPQNLTTTNTGNWIMEKESSFLEIKAVQSGTPFNARFEQFDTIINFDPNQLPTSNIKVLINSQSFLSGLPDIDNNATGADWLDAAAFPQASWQSTQIVQLADSNYLAEGILQIRDAKIPLSLSFSLDIIDKIALAKGHTEFDRFNIDLGRGDLGGEDIAARKIEIMFEINAKLKGS